MAANILRSWLDGQRGRVLWIEFDDYARRVFAGNPADWLKQATRCANTIAQARSVIRSEVLSLDVLAPVRAALEASSDEDAVERIRSALADPAGRAFTTEVLDALAHRFAQDLDLVLKLTSPRDLLAACGVEDPGFDELDDVTMALSELVRTFSEKPIAGLLLSRAAAEAVSADEADAYATLVGSAQHYRWITALALTAGSPATGAVDGLDVDVLLYPELPAAQLAAVAADGVRCGGGLVRSYWLAPDAPATPDTGVLYGSVPESAEPELVLARVKALIA
jgi:hypothetical protein